MPTGKSAPQGAAQAGQVSLRVRWVLLFYGVLASVAVIWRLWADQVLPWRSAHTAPSLRPGLGSGSESRPASRLVVVSRAWVARSSAGQRLASELGRLLGPLSWRRAWLFALASGLAEEALVPRRPPAAGRARGGDAAVRRRALRSEARASRLVPLRAPRRRPVRRAVRSDRRSAGARDRPRRGQRPQPPLARRGARAPRARARTGTVFR